MFIRAGLKSHGPGMHDYPQFLADWSKILTEHGARVMGSLQFPSAADLSNTDVLVMYKGDAGYMTDEEKANLDAYVKRGEANFSSGQLKTTIVDKSHPIMEGMSDFTIADEAFMMMTWAKTPEIHVLATVAMPGGTHKDEVVPQIWTYEHTVPGGQPSRAFVWMQGHTYKNFSEPAIQAMILRGISWAAKKPVDTLANVIAPNGGRGPGGSDIVVPPGAPGAAPATLATPGTAGRGRGRGGIEH